MNLYNETLKREAETAYRKFIKTSKSLFGINKKISALESFKVIQKKEQAHSSSNLGIREVSLDKIVGSVEKYKDFDKNFVPKNEIIKERWIKIYIAYMNEQSIPPVILYKIKDNYYVYDGNHRVSVAKFLDYPSVEAEVIEFLPSGEKAEDLIYREKFIFEKETDIQNIVFTELGRYERLETEIKMYRQFLKEKKNLNCTYKESSKFWYKDIYKNVVKILESNNILEYYEGFNINDLFIFILDHKGYLSREKQQETGYLYSVVDFINMVKTNESVSLSCRCTVSEDTRANFIKLKKTDKEMKLSQKIIEGNALLLKMTGIDFDYKNFTFELIEKFQKANKIKNYPEALKTWYEQDYMHLLRYFLIKVKKLPEKYSRYLKLFSNNEKKIFYSIHNFRRLHYYYGNNPDKPNLIDWKNASLNYIIEIYINIIDGIILSGISDSKAVDVYYLVEKEYFYLLKNERILDSEKKEVTYNKIKEAESAFFLNWFGKKFKNTDVSEILTDERYEEFSGKISSKKYKQRFERIYQKYSGINIYSTFMKLEKILELEGEKDFISDLEKNLKILTNTNYIVKCYKTLEVLINLDEDKENITFLDFYAKVIYYALSIGPDFMFLNILDIALDYLSNNENIKLFLDE